MTKNATLKKIDFLLSATLVIMLISGFGTAYSIIGSAKVRPPIHIQTSPLVLGYSTDKCNDRDSLSLHKSIYIASSINFFEDANNPITLMDHCTDSTKLVEYFCEYDKENNNANVKSIIYNCENSCQEGACTR